MKYLVKRGSTSNIIVVKLKQDGSAAAGSQGKGKTGLTNSSTGLIISLRADNESTATAYTSAASNIETITTPGTYSAPTTNKIRFKEIDPTNLPGQYEIQIADSRFSVSSSKKLYGCISGVSGVMDCDFEIQLTDVDVNDSVRAGMTALPNANAGASGGVLVVGTGSGGVNPSGGKVPATLASTDVTGNLSADLQKWLGSTPAVLDGGGTVQANALLINGSTDAASGLQSISEYYFTNAYLPVWMQYISNGIGDPVSVGLGLGAVNDIAVSNSGRIDARATALSNNVITNASINAGALNGKGDWLSAAGVRSAVGLAAANLDTQLGGINGQTSQLTFTVAGQVDSNVITKTGFSLSSTANDAIATAILDLANAVGTNTFREMLRGIASVLLGKSSGAGTGTEVFRDVADTKNVVTATVDASGNRTAVSRNLT